MLKGCLFSWKLVQNKSGANRRTSPATGSDLEPPLPRPRPAPPRPAPPHLLRDHLIQTKRVLRIVTHASALH